MTIGYFPEANIIPPIYKLSSTNTGNTSDKESTAIGLFVTKSSQKWRNFKVLKPENYMRTTNLIVDNYDDLQNVMTAPTKILSYSNPQVFTKPSQRSGKQIKGWLAMQRDMLSASSVNRLSYLVEVDIQNCYDTLYTHSIEWALGKKLGKKLDRSIRNGNQRRTHGLPVGPYASDILAEVVLCWVDRNIEKSLNRTSYLGYRYKDNYYFLCKGKSEAEKVLSKVAEQLRNAHFSINDQKTNIGLYTNYHLAMWQTDHKLLIQSLGLKSKGANFTQQSLQTFIDQSLKLSQQYNNGPNILEKTVNYIAQGKMKGVIHYDELFYAVSGMLPLRTLSYPKILAYLKLISTQKPVELKDIFRIFIMNEINDAYSRKDPFALLWLSYIIYDMSDTPLKERAIYCLTKMKQRNPILKDMITYLDSTNNIALWNSNLSQIKIERNDYKNAKRLYDYLGLTFGES